MHRASAKANVSALDWTGAGPQTLLVEVTDNGGAMVATATVIVTLRAEAGA